MGKERPWGTALMKRVLVLVEGQTEERFVRDVLCPNLWGQDIEGFINENNYHQNI